MLTYTYCIYSWNTCDNFVFLHKYNFNFNALNIFNELINQHKKTSLIINPENYEMQTMHGQKISVFILFMHYKVYIE